jgi:hypothetical protein
MTPYFLWDYDLSENQIHAILHGNNEMEKLWLMGRIVTHARFEDIWKYFTLEDVLKAFPKLRLPLKARQNWQRAFRVWGYHV